MPLVHILDHDVYYETGGDGPAVVLLHHATATLDNWRGQIGLLQAKGYATLAYDRHGFGKSQPLAAWSTSYHEDGVAELIALLDALRLERVALVGHSDGATISLMAAARYPHRIAAVIAEAPHMWIDPEWLSRGFETFRTTVGISERFWRAMRRYHGDQAEQVVKRWRQRWLDPAFRQWDVSATLSRVQSPVLILHGEHDIFFPYSHSQAIAAQLANAECRLIKAAGHSPHLENKPVFDQLLLDFLALHWPPQRR